MSTNTTSLNALYDAFVGNMLIYKLDQEEEETRSVVSHRSHKAEIRPKLKLTEFTPSIKPLEVTVRLYIIRVSELAEYK